MPASTRGAVRATVFPTLEEIFYLHARLIARHGGAAGVRDLGLVESTLARPRSGYYASLSEQAAAWVEARLEPAW